MKVILFNGSPRSQGNTFQALSLCADTLQKNGIDTEILQISDCGTFQDNICTFDSLRLEEYSEKLRQADGLVVGIPVYYAGLTGNLKTFLDYFFPANVAHMRFKPAASIAVARRAGTTSTCDQINHYFSLGEMVNVPTIYWSDIYGAAPGDVAGDQEGINHVVTIGNNMAWLLKVLEVGKQAVPPPPPVTRIRTNFIR